MPDPSNDSPRTNDGPFVLTLRVLGGDISLAHDAFGTEDPSLTTDESIGVLSIHYQTVDFKADHYGPSDFLTVSIGVGKTISAGLLVDWIHDRLQHTNLGGVKMDVHDSINYFEREPISFQDEDDFEWISVERSELEDAITEWLENKD